MSIAMRDLRRYARSIGAAVDLRAETIGGRQMIRVRIDRHGTAVEGVNEKLDDAAREVQRSMEAVLRDRAKHPTWIPGEPPTPPARRAGDR